MRILLTLLILLAPLSARATDMSDYLELEILDHVLKNTAYTAPSTVYIALYSATPSDSGGGTELTVANGYARQAITFGTVASAGSIASSATVTFTASGGDWSTATHAGIFDASTAGNLVFWGALTASFTLTDGNSEEFTATNISVALD
jgi:hypothetical protein